MTMHSQSNIDNSEKILSEVGKVIVVTSKHAYLNFEMGVYLTHRQGTFSTLIILYRLEFDVPS